MMPGVIREKLRILKIDHSAIETLIDEMPAAKAVLDSLDYGASNDDARRVALWLAGDVQAFVSNEERIWDNLNLEPEGLVALSKLTSDNKVSSTGAKKILLKMVQDGGDPEAIAKELDVLQVSDEGELDAIVQRVIESNQKAADDVRSGEMKAIGFLVGQVMKESKGKANPALAQQLIKKQLGL